MHRKVQAKSIAANPVCASLGFPQSFDFVFLELPYRNSCKEINEANTVAFLPTVGIFRDLEGV
jgi:hypothetical protein